MPWWWYPVRIVPAFVCVSPGSLTLRLRFNLSEGPQAEKNKKKLFQNERTTTATPSRITLHSHSLTHSHLLQSISRFGETLTSSHPPISNYRYVHPSDDRRFGGWGWSGRTHTHTLTLSGSIHLHLAEVFIYTQRKHLTLSGSVHLPLTLSLRLLSAFASAEDSVFASSLAYT